MSLKNLKGHKTWYALSGVSWESFKELLKQLGVVFDSDTDARKFLSGIETDLSDAATKAQNDVLMQKIKEYLEALKSAKLKERLKQPFLWAYNSDVADKDLQELSHAGVPCRIGEAIDGEAGQRGVYIKKEAVMDAARFYLKGGRRDFATWCLESTGQGSDERLQWLEDELVAGRPVSITWQREGPITLGHGKRVF